MTTTVLREWTARRARFDISDQSTHFDAMDIFVALAGERGSLARDLYDQMRTAIVDGRLSATTRVPSSRVLAEQLGISRHTVAITYARLIGEGFLETRRGAGTFVAS